jgi:hypothetical protein
VGRKPPGNEVTCNDEVKVGTTRDENSNGINKLYHNTCTSLHKSWSPYVLVTVEFFNGLTAPWGPGPPHILRLHDHTQTHHTR